MLHHLQSLLHRRVDWNMGEQEVTMDPVVCIPKRSNLKLCHRWWHKYINEKMASAEWREGIVEQLADFLQKMLPDPRGFSDKNLWRMRQSHDLYGDYEKLSTVLREIPWSSQSPTKRNRQVLGRRRRIPSWCIGGVGDEGCDWVTGMEKWQSDKGTGWRGERGKMAMGLTDLSLFSECLVVKKLKINYENMKQTNTESKKRYF